MITGDYDRLQGIAKFNVCAEHHTPLEIAWHSGEKTWVLRCGEGHYPDAVTRQLSLTEQFKMGLEPPEPIKSYIEKGLRRRTMTQSGREQETKFALVPQTDLGTGELLVPEVIKALVNYAHKYDLDPERGHVVLMYGKPYITIDGYLFHAALSGIPYTLESRPLTTSEAKQYKVGPTDHAWLAKVIFTSTGQEFTGLGIVTYEEMTAKSPRDDTKFRSPVVAAHPWQLGQKRAEWQALRRAFPIGEPPPQKEEVSGDTKSSEAMED